VDHGAASGQLLPALRPPAVDLLLGAPRERQDVDVDSLVEGIADRASQKGTGRRTAQEDLELGTAATSIAEAVSHRSLSALGDQRRAVRDTWGGVTPTGSDDRDALVDDLGAALFGGTVVAYAQGFALLAEGWLDGHLDLGGAPPTHRVVAAMSATQKSECPSLLMSPKSLNVTMLNSRRLKAQSKKAALSALSARQKYPISLAAFLTS